MKLEIKFKIIAVLAFITLGCLCEPGSVLVTNTPAPVLSTTSDATGSRVPPTALTSPPLGLPTFTPPQFAPTQQPPNPTLLPLPSSIPTDLLEPPSDTPQPTSTPTAELPEAPGPGGDVAVVEPQFGPVGTTHIITFKEFEPNSIVEVRIVSDDTQTELFKVETLIDAEGNGTVQYTTKNGDMVGTYTVWVTGKDVNSKDKVAKGKFAITAT